MRPVRPLLWGFLLVTGSFLAGGPALLGPALLGPRFATAAAPAELPSGPSFRVETELFEGDAVQPAARHLILFDAGVIYDIRLDSGRTATLYDPTRQRVILIDRVRKQQTVVATEDLLRATAQLRGAAEQQGKGEAFGLNAKVQPVTPKEPSELPSLQIEFGNVLYTATTQPVSKPQLAQAYHAFATLAAQLNVVRRRGVPPFARMTLGEQIAAAGEIPLELKLEVWSGIKKERYRAHHLVVEQLSELDRKRIAEIGRDLAQCEEVSLDQFAE
ncbi:hypothetical protein [Candidatus Laterigemmans baculatus]|uniref:hypothetical protein n=1 Tax=Candidatus Laterigemmans baculatus TaxID=2770505 RepID=UPI0013DC5A69|nr:hypothetical protein [Candidatus Laterigemmans baculatus]